MIRNYTSDGWRIAMRRVSRLDHVSDEIRDAFLRIWIQSKDFALEVGERKTMAAALKVLLRTSPKPKGSLELYRGCEARSVDVQNVVQWRFVALTIGAGLWAPV
jgi:hypothetical protein